MWWRQGGPQPHRPAQQPLVPSCRQGMRSGLSDPPRSRHFPQAAIPVRDSPLVQALHRPALAFYSLDKSDIRGRILIRSPPGGLFLVFSISSAPLLCRATKGMQKGLWERDQRCPVSCYSLFTAFVKREKMTASRGLLFFCEVIMSLSNDFKLLCGVLPLYLS